jgi:hypothetical protein
MEDYYRMIDRAEKELLITVLKSKWMVRTLKSEINLILTRTSTYHP